MRHGPLDLEAIRRVDRGEVSANEAFSSKGILRRPFETKERLFGAIRRKDRDTVLLMDSLVMAVAMEISGLDTAAGGVDAIAVSTGLGEVKMPINLGIRVSKYLGRKVDVFSRFSAALGAGEIGHLPYKNVDGIIGVPIHR
jgi:hypothetical protein